MKEKIKVDCENCIFYEQVIKEKDRCIAELEEENVEMKKVLFGPHNVRVENNTLTEINNWQNGEISRLHEQLKNAIVPKYNVGDEVFVNLTDMDFVKKTFCLKISGIDYRYILETKPYGRFDERDLFDTESEAQKYLEERNDNKQ